jgi:RNA polymerase sigma-70 factor (ECF subfamily)
MTTAGGDPELVAAIQSGEPEGPRNLWNRYASMVFRILRRRFGTEDRVEDLAQEVFFCVFRRLPKLRKPQALKAFIISTTVLTARQELRHRRIRQAAASIADRTPLELASIRTDFDAREGLDRLRDALSRLNARDRKAFVLRFVQAMDLADVASGLQVSLATAKRSIARGWARIALLAQRDPVLAEYVGPTRPSTARRPTVRPSAYEAVRCISPHKVHTAVQSATVLDHAVLVEDVVVGLLDHGDTRARGQL